MTIGAQIAESVDLHKGLRGKEVRECVLGLLDDVGIPDAARRYDEYPHQLSGGMKQRVSLARVLILQPAVLLMDEPFAALDAQTRMEMHDLLTGLWHRLAHTILFVTHDVQEAVTLADRGITSHLLCRKGGALEARATARVTGFAWSGLADLAGLEGLDHAVLRGHTAYPVVCLDAHQVFSTTMLGNLLL